MVEVKLVETETVPFTLKHCVIGGGIEVFVSCGELCYSISDVTVTIVNVTVSESLVYEGMSTYTGTPYAQQLVNCYCSLLQAFLTIALSSLCALPGVGAVSVLFDDISASPSPLSWFMSNVTVMLDHITSVNNTGNGVTVAVDATILLDVSVFLSSIVSSANSAFGEIYCSLQVALPVLSLRRHDWHRRYQ
jgi:hypothetical protein